MKRKGFCNGPFLYLHFFVDIRVLVAHWILEGNEARGRRRSDAALVPCLTNTTTSIHFLLPIINSSSSHAFPKYTIQIPNLPNTFLHCYTPIIRQPIPRTHTTTWGWMPNFILYSITLINNYALYKLLTLHLITLAILTNLKRQNSC